MAALAEYPKIAILKDFARKKKTNVFLVGGFLRDHWLGQSTMDFDFAIPKGAVAFAKAFAKEVKGVFVLLDQERGCGRVVCKNNGAIETYDFADLRAASLKKDLRLRDFTINTLLVEISKVSLDEDIASLIVDHCGAKKDLKARVVRMVADRVFRDDPLRLLRAFSLKAKFGLKIEAKTLARIKKDRDLIRQVAAERILDELFKILASPRAAENLRMMDAIGLLEKIIPQVSLMYGVKQGGYHHLDVWPHSLEVVAQLEKIIAAEDHDPRLREYLFEPLAGGRPRAALLKLAALLHDIGKPQTYKKEGERVSFHSHEHVGKRIARPIAKQLKLSSRERMILEDMVLWHLRPGYLSNFKVPSERAYFRYFRDTKDEAASIAVLSLADQRSTRGPLTSEADQAHHEKICREIIRRYFVRKQQAPFVPFVNGHDLIKKLKLKPSPLFGKILKAVQEAQATGKVTDARQALEFARAVAEKG